MSEIKCQDDNYNKWIKERQRNGINKALREGRPYGRPPVKMSDTFPANYKKWKDGKITATEFMKQESLPRTTFYRLVKRYESEVEYAEEINILNNKDCEVNSMDNLVDKYKNVITAIFPELEETATNIGQVLSIEIKRPYVVASLEGFICEAFDCKGKAKWNPHDKWDELTGVIIALTKLRVALNEKTRKFFTKMVWIPKVGETYYVPFIAKLENNFFGFPSAKPVVWSGNELDLIRLSLGNVYRTKREARKAIRRNILRGQSMVKEFKSNGE